MLVSDIPGYVEAVMHEQLVRDAALLNIHESINGFEVMPMTGRHYLILRMAGSPFIPPFTAPIEDELEQFLWVLNPEFGPSKRDWKRFKRRCECFKPLPDPLWRTLRKIRDQFNQERLAIFAETVRCAHEYVNEVMLDKPPMQSGTIQQAPFYSDILGHCAMLDREFGWTLEYALNLPLKITFQLSKEITVQHSLPGSPPLIGNPSDRIKSHFLNERNKALKRN